jgi:EAL domain-containing protein (putative c-di-GMP-specific phosphodiesterase class I)
MSQRDFGWSKMPSPARLLGFAFAGADLLVELDDQWRVTYAAGAPPGPGLSADSLNGRRLQDLLAPASANRLSAILSKLTAGRRLDPVEVAIGAGDGFSREGVLRAVMLPDLAPCISCAITYTGPIERPAEPPAAIATADTFAERALDVLTHSHAAGAPLSLAMVELSGLDRTISGAPALLKEIETSLQAASIGGNTAGRIADQRYALLREQGAPPADISDAVRTIAARHSQSVDATVSQSDVAPEVDPMANLRAMRFTLDAFMEGRVGGGDAAAITFTGAVMRTLKEADDFRAIVANRDFDLCYQPVVKLNSGTVHHYEVLARFAPDTSPAGVIRMAEELALIGEFDLVVAERAVKIIREKRRDDLKLAVNVSAQSLSSDRFASSLMAMTADDFGSRPRLMLEVTESAALGDIEEANTRLQALRSAGFKIAIDDFGSGAASFDYLRRLSVDAVKIDGRFVREAVSDVRSQNLITHLVSLCRSLKLETVAEMIETEDVAALMLTLGVDQGQGWQFGRPAAQPGPPVGDSQVVRRRGSVESWG